MVIVFAFPADEQMENIKKKIKSGLDLED